MNRNHAAKLPTRLSHAAVTGSARIGCRAGGAAIVARHRGRRIDYRLVIIASRPATEPRVALVHDFLLDVRGAERVFLQLCAIWPTAEIFTAVYDPVGTEGRFADRVVHTSFLQHVRPTARTFRALLPLYPSAIESFDLLGL